MHTRKKIRVVRGGLYNTHIYRGHLSGSRQRIIVARSANEAYALMLDSLAGEQFELNEVFADLETDKKLLAQYRYSPVGVYDIGAGAEQNDNNKERKNVFLRNYNRQNASLPLCRQ